MIAASVQCDIDGIPKGSHDVLLKRANGGVEPPRGEAERSARTTCYTPVNGWLPTRVSLATRHALAELFGKPDNDALGAADVADPIRVLVLHHFADQFGAAGAQARDDVVDVIDGEHDAADPECVHRNVLGPSSDRFRRVELVQLDPSVAVRSAHQHEGSADVLKADETIYRGALDGRLALQLHTKFDKECLGSLKVVDHDEDVVHALERHVFSSHI